ncbi:exodeoxyribonuclease VII large subunit [Pedobacter sp.]|uniref:exodeoxyribonuclease VII large subunit n=1 Tax=Pedobacter sp. TaxID=1411316 RepID=UPI003D7FB482
MVPPTIIKLSALSRQIKQALDGVFSNATFWVIADINSHTFKAETNQHYFELVEKDKFSSRIMAKIAARAWGTAASHIANFEKSTGQKFTNDINVLMQVAVHYHEAYGLQLQMVDIDTNFTLGKFEQQRMVTLERLLRENPTYIQKIGDVYITKNSKLNLRKVIQNIAVISSVTSAGFQDFEHTLIHNSFNYKFNMDLYLTKVQGEQNALALVNKLIEVFNSKIDYDAVIIIRGGGAQSDFLLFDNYELTRAVARFPIPIITGIGHQKNETLVDLMANSATKTPTRAAELIIAHNRKFEESLLVMQKKIIIRTQQILVWHTKSLNDFKSHFMKDVLSLLQRHQRKLQSLSGIFINRPKMLLSNQHKDIDGLFGKIKIFNKILIMHERMQLEHFQSIVRMMSPENILKKGFAILKFKGEIITNALPVKPGDQLTIQLANEEIETIVTSKVRNNGN